MSEAITCPACRYQTLVESHGAPGGSDWRCVVCDLREENRVLQESRERLATDLGHARDLIDAVNDDVGGDYLDTLAAPDSGSNRAGGES